MEAYPAAGCYQSFGRRIRHRRECAVFASVANWTTSRIKDIEWRGENYFWEQITRVREIRAGACTFGEEFELATMIRDESTRQLFLKNVADPHLLSIDHDHYRAYLQNSKGVAEWLNNRVCPIVADTEDFAEIAMVADNCFELPWRAHRILHSFSPQIRYFNSLLCRPGYHLYRALEVLWRMDELWSCLVRRFQFPKGFAESSLAMQMGGTRRRSRTASGEHCGGLSQQRVLWHPARRWCFPRSLG
jgi:hypothetical protein